MRATAATLIAIPGIGEVRPGDDLAAILIDALDRAALVLAAHDILVVAQKIVSKAEGRYLDLREVTPSARARALAAEVEKDARLVEAILSESEEVVAYRPGVLVVAHRLGYVMANAGIDRSNLASDAGEDRVLLLPIDPDGSAGELKARLEERYGVRLAVIVSDSVGRAWRNGVVGLALGAAGLPALHDMVGKRDRYGRRLEVTQVALADGFAAAATLVMGEADQGTPAVLVRGFEWTAPAADGRSLLRPKEFDLFR